VGGGAWLFADKYDGGKTQTLRKELLSINGVGPETADSILLYALNRPVFVVDAYTRRLFTRLGFTLPDEYDDITRLFTRALPRDAALYNEYHALIVTHSKERCKKLKPECEGCPLSKECVFNRIAAGDS
jgi:endonuclease-3 related protein